jgi:hypothetical protein
MRAYGKICPQAGGQGYLEADGRAMASMRGIIHPRESRSGDKRAKKAIEERHSQMGLSLKVVRGAPGT